MLRPLLPLALLAALSLSSCFDPVHADAVDSLGPEAAGVREGPRHRPGQPCGVCHGGSGPGPEFIAGGTVYERRGSSTPLEGVVVVLTDKNNHSTSLRTNDVGNFYLEKFDFDFPIRAELQYSANGVTRTKLMLTRIGRDGGCGSCHLGAGDTRHVPAVYLKEPNDP